LQAHSRKLTPVGFWLPAAAAWAAVAFPQAAFGDGSNTAFLPKPNHIGVVVTTDEVFVSWEKPPGVPVAHVIAVRGDATCPTSPTGGTRVPAGRRVHHVIDRTVTAGDAYCYAMWVEDASGRLIRLGTTGVFQVPNLKALRPTVASAPVPAPPTAAPGSDGLLHASGVRLAMLAAAAVLAGAMGILGTMGLVRRSRRREPTGDQMWGMALRLSVAGYNRSALIIPAAIALAWIVVTAAVVFR
jgi:hypothetical protein